MYVGWYDTSKCIYVGGAYDRKRLGWYSHLCIRGTVRTKLQMRVCMHCTREGTIRAGGCTRDMAIVPNALPYSSSQQPTESLNSYP